MKQLLIVLSSCAADMICYNRVGNNVYAHKAHQHQSQRLPYGAQLAQYISTQYGTSLSSPRDMEWMRMAMRKTTKGGKRKRPSKFNRLDRYTRHMRRL